ncbi:MAG: DUF4138 domain-containing protein [Bacteroidota bacterium]
MKKVVLVLVFLALNSALIGQKIDTIYVNVDQKTYVALDDVVEWADPGIDDYLGEPVGKTLFLLASKKNLPPASLVIKAGDRYLHLTIAYKALLTQEEQFVDLRDVDMDNIPEFDNEERVKESQVPISTKIVNRRLGILIGNKADTYKNVAMKAHSLIYKLTNIMQDDKFYYFKVTLDNRSKVNFDLDFVDFEYKDQSREIDQTTQANIIDALTVVTIDSKEKVNLVYAIEKYNLGKKGKVVSTIREKKGSRTLSFEVDYKEVLNSTKF